MLRFFFLTLFAVGASAECLVCLNGGPPGNPDAVDNAVGGYTCSYLYNNSIFLSGKQCAVIQQPQNQALCGCGTTTLAPVSATSAPISSASMAPVTPSTGVTAAPVSGSAGVQLTTSPIASVSSSAPITAAPIAQTVPEAPVTFAPVSAGGIFAPTDKSPPSCTSIGQDPYEFYSNKTSIPCCVEATECLSNWDGDDRMFYRCYIDCSATSAPGTVAPVNVAPASSAPVTIAPFSPVSSTAPVTIAPVSSTDTMSPAGSSAPVTSVPMSSAPGTSAPVTSAPSVTFTPTSNDTSAPVTFAPVSSFGEITFGNATPTDLEDLFVASANQGLTSGTPATSIVAGMCASVVFALMMM